MTDHHHVELPAWDNSAEYPALSSPELRDDLERAEAHLRVVAELSAILERGLEGESPDRGQLIPTAQKLMAARREAHLLLQQIGTFAHCEASTDGGNAEARALIARIEELEARVHEYLAPAMHFEAGLTDEEFALYCADPIVAESEFRIRQARRHLAPHLLPIREEKLISALGVNGFTAWGSFYTNLSSTIRCQVNFPDGRTETLGLAAATGLLQRADGGERRAAWSAIQRAWRAHEEAPAAVLNAISGWRLEIFRRRSHTRPVDMLTEPLYYGRINRETLESLIGVAGELAEVPRRALRLMAGALGQTRLAAADLFAPLPDRLAGGDTLTSYRGGLEQIRAAFSGVSPEMAGLVELMDRERWIEARVLPAKRPGAYCTEFAKSRAQRVFMTWEGGGRDLKTLAHELGHAFHSWVMRDLPLPQAAYPMTVAETASNFGEMVLADHLEHTGHSSLDGLWQELGDGVAYLLNIPARFDFERQLYTERARRVLGADDLRSLMGESWRRWYGDTLSEVDEMFWASKLHFHMTELAFYNFPYIFGFLFSLSIYSRRAALGERFYPLYRELLRESGRMTVEDLARKHLDADITAPEFWREGVRAFEQRVNRFEAALREAELRTGAAAPR